MNLTVEQLEELEKVARAATPGPWVRSGVRQKVGGADTHSVVATEGGKEIIFASVWYDPKTHAGFSDAVYIATFDPPTILALLSTARQAGEVGEGWQPIETAPRDGTTLLLAHESNGAVFDGWWENGAWVDGCTDAYEDLTTYRPSHWRPLPDPPLISASPSLSSVKGEENGGLSSGSLDPVRAGARAPNETPEGEG